jgi:hypothetical protein
MKTLAAAQAWTADLPYSNKHQEAGGPCPAGGRAVCVDGQTATSAGPEMNMWRNEDEQFGSAFKLTAQP